MFNLEKKQKWHFRTTIASGLLLFTLIHFFYDPYTVIESIAESTDEHELNPGAPAVRLAVVPDVKPGESYRAAARVAWDSVEAGDPAWKTARIVFSSHNKQGRWIPSPHVVRMVTGSGKDSFEADFSIPDGAVSSRLSLQHYGKTGWIRLTRFSLQHVELKKSTSLVFKGLQTVWFLLAGWAIWRLRLMRRWGGVAVVLVAGLIAVGMLIPGEVVREAPDRMADLVRPAAPAVNTASSALTERKEQAQEPEAGSGVREVSPMKYPVETRFHGTGAFTGQGARRRIAKGLQSLDIHLLGHAGLFLLLGVVCGLYYRYLFKDWHGVFYVLAGGVVYAIAAELLQVTELTRTVRCSDIGVNVLGWLTGLLAIALIARGHGRRTACGE